MTLEHLVETLGRAIKCMTPCYMYDYYCAFKSVLLFAGLFEAYIVDVLKEDLNLISEKIETVQQDFDVIGKICFIIYQNIIHTQNSQPRSLPTFEHEISKEYQMYYLNHTLVGPQIYLLKMFEKSVPYIFKKD
jgi:hypothetical protein